MNKYISCLFIIIGIACSKKNYEEPTIDLSSYQIEKDFELKAVTSEPFIEAPVTMDFDNKGRIWVVEMRGYMQNLDGTGENMPNGRIVILEDLDNDGITDHSKVFLDSLILPRALAHVYGGLLYAEPPNLWFVEIKDDKPLNKVLVDDKYVTSGNVEHQPNGLMMHIDNWIYNAKSSYRYQRKFGKWYKERTYFRGQWGISKDNFGRLYHNHNSVILRGDLVLPNTYRKNPNFIPEVALGKTLNKNQRVYPLHATSVNRGYIKGNLDKDSLLVNVTAACAPLIYRGDQFPSNYMENAFICAPEANVVKRNVLNFSNNDINAIHPTANKEFLASTDEGFRPVNLFNGPDGNIYVVDMHRGILQDKAYLTPYLKKHYKNKQLDTVIGMGRILKIQHKDYKPKEITNLTKSNTKDLVTYLDHPNGWYRDRAQQLLIQRKDYHIINDLKKLISNTNNPITQIHALHTLNGLDALSFNFLYQLTKQKEISSKTLSHIIVLIEQKAHTVYISDAKDCLEHLVTKNNMDVDIYLASSLGKWIQLSPKSFYPVLLKIANRHKNKNIIQEGVLSSISQQEENFLAYINNQQIDNPLLISYIDEVIKTKEAKAIKKNIIIKKQNELSINAGKSIFNNLCANCHGDQGEGITNLAPPFINSEYISESSNRLALVLLHGLSGPIKVNGKSYNLTATMPGLINNPEYSDKDIQNIIAYLQHTFSDDPKPISTNKIKKLRNLKPKSGVFSEEELLKIK
ncbi:hypothetical protein AXE80_01960 [Wenyingzhuangia fucanilytica]|uniref:Cytochrome c domain-containing protein n=1 Tax=Wenyingzhuangia fucanilytica TaxID=1790137 RepID=A0A1B1Y310_9FLAO|nr:c-type cytochrome [Wenyingzhuangia fucanilytica]ANW95128.1 hypothetical protein AXE80_01960 [Wenyingzhuangia fucanilytica]